MKGSEWADWSNLYSFFDIKGCARVKGCHIEAKEKKGVDNYVEGHKVKR